MRWKPNAEMPKYPTYGMSCTEDEPCAVYLELTAVESAGSKLFVSQAICTPARTTLWSILLTSEDNGQSWKRTIQQVAWRGTRTDTVPRLSPPASSPDTRPARLPKDPFFLRTSDGGKTWSRLPLFEDGAVGLIEQFRFESATRGTVAVDRGRPGVGRYVQRWRRKTAQNPGPSGNLAADAPASGPPAIPRRWFESSPNANPKSFRIERRESGAWRTAAAFFVAAGACQSRA